MEKLRQADKVTLESFSRAMQAKLLKKQNEGRSGWDDPQQVSIEALKTMLAEHVEKGDMVDVANLAMMIWWREIVDRYPATPERVREFHNIWTSE